MATPETAPSAESVAPPDILVKVDGLRVCYGARWALDGVSFTVAAGQVVGLLGPNGAGKTTTFSVLATLRRPDAGTVEMCGWRLPEEAAAVRRVIGCVPQALALYPTLTAHENLRFFARVLGMGRAARRAAAARTLEIVGLADRADDIVSTFSGGMQRRLNLACGLLHTPRVLLLDEPTVGVDPQSRERIFDAVRQHAAAGAAVLYSTHYMEEAESLCDRVVLIDCGRVIADGPPAELIERAADGVRLEIVTRAPLPSQWWEDLGGVRVVADVAPPERARVRGHWVNVVVEASSTAPRVLERAAVQGGEVLEFHVHQPDLQDVFMKLTGTELRD